MPWRGGDSPWPRPRGCGPGRGFVGARRRRVRRGRGVLERAAQARLRGGEASGDGGVRGGASGGGRARSSRGRVGVSSETPLFTTFIFCPERDALSSSSTTVDSSRAPASANESSVGASGVMDVTAARRRASASVASGSSSGSVAASPALAKPPSRLSVSEPAAADANASAASLRASPLVGAARPDRIASFALGGESSAVDPTPSTSTATSPPRRASDASSSTSSTRLPRVTLDVATPGSAARARGGARRCPPPSVSVPETNSPPDEAAGALDVSIGSSKESSAASDASSKASSSPRPVSARRPPSPFPSPTRLASRYAASPSSASSADTKKLSSSIAAARPRATRVDTRGLPIAFPNENVVEFSAGSLVAAPGKSRRRSGRVASGECENSRAVNAASFFEASDRHPHEHDGGGRRGCEGGGGQGPDAHRAHRRALAHPRSRPGRCLGGEESVPGDGGPSERA